MRSPEQVEAELRAWADDWEPPDGVSARRIRDIADTLERYRLALVEAAIPLEVLHGLGNSFRLRRLRRLYDRLISRELRQQIERSVVAIRAALWRGGELELWEQEHAKTLARELGLHPEGESNG